EPGVSPDKRLQASRKGQQDTSCEPSTYDRGGGTQKAARIVLLRAGLGLTLRERRERAQSFPAIDERDGGVDEGIGRSFAGGGGGIAGVALTPASGGSHFAGRGMFAGAVRLETFGEEDLGRGRVAGNHLRQHLIHVVRQGEIAFAALRDVHQCGEKI